jgi:hypothetical protein
MDARQLSAARQNAFKTKGPVVRQIESRRDLFMIRTAAFLFCAAMLALSQVRQGAPGGRLDDRIAIDRAIDALNDPSRLSNAFAHSGDGPARYAELRASTPAIAFKILGPLASDARVVTISHEPWGEADFGLSNTLWSQIVFISADVALSEGACTYEEGDGSTRRKPLLFVLKREAGVWKIASLRMLTWEGVFPGHGC